jgi:lipopolysaccharide export system permease protein
VVNHSVSVLSLLNLVVYLIPDLLTIILPIALFISILFVYHRASLDHELIVLRTTGWSEECIARPAMAMAIATMALMYLINFYILPVSFQNFSRLERELRSRYSSSLIHSGEFVHINGVTVFVRQREGLQDLNNIFIFDERRADNPVIISAERGRVTDMGTGLELSLKNGLRQARDPKTKRHGQLKFAEYTHHLKAHEDAQGHAATPHRKKSTERFMTELFFLRDDEASLPQRNRYFVEGWQRILTPLLALAFTAVALDQYVRRLQTRRVERRAIFRTCLGVLGLQVACFALIQMSAQQPIVLLLTALLLLIPVGRCAMLYAQARRQRRAISAHRLAPAGYSL